jgi:hypothetical protein
MWFVLCLLTGVLLVIALALPTAVLARESPATTSAEASGKEAATASVAVTEPGTAPEEESRESNGATIGGLILTVRLFNLKLGIENSLDAKLQNAKDSLDAANAGQLEEAVNKVQAFINACEAQRGKALTSHQFDQLIADGNAVIAGL